VRRAIPRHRRDDESGLRCFRTRSYALHHFRAPTGVHFALTTDLSAGDLRPALRGLYADAFVPFVALNPLHTPGAPISAPAFLHALDAFGRALEAAPRGGQ
jgi:hypothetical protein